jgi:hypothetical protein
MLAAWKDDYENAKWLLEKGADRSLQNPNTGQTALEIADSHCCLKVKAVFQQAPDEQALQDAIEKGSTEKVKKLLQRGASPNGEVNLLAMALNYKRLTVAMLLIEHDADLSRNSEWGTLLSIVTSYREFSITEGNSRSVTPNMEVRENLKRTFWYCTTASPEKGYPGWECDFKSLLLTI